MIAYGFKSYSADVGGFLHEIVKCHMLCAAPSYLIYIYTCYTGGRKLPTEEGSPIYQTGCGE